MYPDPSYAARARARGFTLIELLLAVLIMSLAMGVAVATFFAVSRAWQRGQKLAEFLNEGDLVMEQLVAALRSAYFPDAGSGTTSYGFWLEDEGSGPSAHDSISWVKLGDALIDPDSAETRAPHRVRVTIEDDEEGRPSLAVRAWRPYAQPEDFDPEELEPLYLSARVTGLDCQFSTNAADDRLEWEDEWEETNRIPTALKVTLYLEPLAKDEEPLEIRRAVGIPIAPLSWKR